MEKELNPMDKFHFLLGTWKMEYKIPKSRNIIEDIGGGEGVFKRILNNHYVTFDYNVKLTAVEAAAHAIFAWDEKSKIYRFSWFEDSGEFMQATCNFINEHTLYLNWHNSLLVQTFQQIEDGKIILQMKNPINKNDYEIILEVVFTKKK